MQVMRLLLSQQIDHKTASLLLYALQTASTNLRLTNFKPLTNDVILDVRDVANTPLDEHIWEDDDFEEEESELEAAADLAIEALHTAEKKQREGEKWTLWAETKYPDPRKHNPSAAATGSAVVANSPAGPPKKPASSLNHEKLRDEIGDMIRKQFLPAMAEKFAPGTQPEKRPEKKAT